MRLLHAGVDATVIANLIPRALSWLERLVRRTLLTSTIKVTFDLEDLLTLAGTYRRELYFDDTRGTHVVRNSITQGRYDVTVSDRPMSDTVRSLTTDRIAKDATTRAEAT